MNLSPVLHLGQYYPPYPGGIETYTKVFCEGLVNHGIDTDVVVSNDLDSFKEEYINGVHIFRLPRKFLISSRPCCPSMPSFVKKLFKKRQYKIVHLHHPNIMSEITYLFANANNDHKLFLSYHADSIVLRKNAKLINLTKRFYNEIVMHRIYKKCTKICLSSQRYRETRHSLIPFLSKCAVVPIPVNSYFLSQPVTCEEINEIKSKYNKFILFVGNFVAYKGIKYLIKAMKNIEANLLLIGTGIDEKILKSIVKDESLQDKVHFIGRRVIENGLKNYYDACTVFCLPSSGDQESYGIVLLEAMSCAKPIISTEIGTGTSWVNQDGQTGFVVPPCSPDALATAINKLLANEALRMNMGINARTRVEKYFATEEVIDQLIELYNN